MNDLSPKDSGGNESLRKKLLIDAAAKNDFDAALLKGFWRGVISWFRRTDNRLLPFDEVQRNLPIGGRHAIGNRQVLMSKIVGSIGRYQDFDRAFLPRHTFIRGRWESVDKAHLQEISLPPVELYKVGDIYFVKDGNHRVSVARERGQAYIDAYVIEIDVPFQVDENSDITAIILQNDAAQFDEKTHLSQIRPEAEIRFSLPGSMLKVLEHIQVHQYYMGEKRNTAVPYEEAVAHWYDDVYLPLVRVIRQNRILDEFPGRTEADLYLWIIEHLYYLREEYQAEVSFEQAVEHFTDEFSKKPFAWFINLIRRISKKIENEKES